MVVSKLCRQLRLIKNDILGGGTEKSSSPIYHAWIDSVRTTILPQKVFQKDSIYYDLQCTPLGLPAIHGGDDEGRGSMVKA